MPHTPNDVTYQLFGTRNYPSRASHEVYIFLLQPMGYQPAKRRPCIGESTRTDSHIDRVRRGTHIQGLEYTTTDKVCEAHAGQGGHDICTNHVHLLSISGKGQNWRQGRHTWLLYSHSSRSSTEGRKFRRFLVISTTLSFDLYDKSWLTTSISTIDVLGGRMASSPCESGYMGKYINQICLFARPWIQKLPVIWKDVSDLCLPTQG